MSRVFPILCCLAAGCEPPDVDTSAIFGVGAASIEVEPTEMFFDERAGEQATAPLYVRNVGDGDLLLTHITALLSDAFHVEGAPGVMVMPPGSEVAVEVVYQPTQSNHTAWVAVRSDDPFAREILVALTGSSPAELLVTPDELHFDTLFVGEQQTLSVEVANLGGQAVEVEATTLDIVGPFTFGPRQDTGTLSGGDSMFTDVVFAPVEPDVAAYEGALRLTTSVGAFEVPIFAGAVTAPELLIEPDILDFGNVLPGDDQTIAVTVSNVGGQPLELLALTLDVDGPFSMAANAGTLQPGEQRVTEVSFAPTALSSVPFDGFLVVDTNQGDSVLLPVHATSQNTPIARCEASPPVIPPISGSSDFIGSDSFNTEGGGLSYQWTLIEQPPGSSVVLPTTDTADVLGFQPLLAGEYVAQLVVTNEMGVQSDPCEAVLTASVEDFLWVEMYWDRAGEDMDLHLVQAGRPTQSAFDCYYANCIGGLSWGAPGTLDDPFLDLDDIPGTGPENINIERPAAGTYEVWAHDYPNGGNGVTNMTVNIYVFGVLAFSEQRSSLFEDSWEHFADITFPSGVVTPRP